MMEKDLLLLPGPTPVPDRVLRAMAAPMVNHRGALFTAVHDKVLAGLKMVYQTQNDVLVLPSAGTGGLEAAIVNFFSPGDRVLAVVTGAFGQRFAKIAGAFGLEVKVLDVPWGQGLDPEAVAKELHADPSLKGVLLTHNETSTGVTNPVGEVAKRRGDHQALILVDAISSLGGIDLPMDELGLDVVVAGSQKALMIPPGLSFLAVSPRAWAAHEVAKLPRFYFDLTPYRKGLAKANTPYTPAVSLWYALQESLQMITEEGLPQVFKRHRLLGEMTRAGAKALGLKLLAEPAVASETVTAIFPPAGVAADEFRGLMRKELGVTMAGGQGPLSGQIFRIGHVGWVAPKDILSGLAALEEGLRRVGHPAQAGAGVAAALEVMGRANA